MPKRSSSKKPPTDPVESAFATMQQIIADTENETEVLPEKNPAAVALGRLGGLKGGKARAKALSARRRREIAAKAALKRWQKTKAK
jgi:hypothetical protein